ncbi:dual specificity protein phosphatase 18-like isoform X2 [Osmerus mordax]|uniref:dual specificity protein phosphatase 18-like isoform X2 n=1 Tax=Osmerus mordax TaxID=8014 RepID=UPI00350EA2FC
MRFHIRRLFGYVFFLFPTPTNPCLTTVLLVIWRPPVTISNHFQLSINRNLTLLNNSVLASLYFSARCPCPMSVSQITPSLFLSGVDAAQKLTLITNRNITLIINATAELIVYPNYKGVEVLHVPVQDQPHAPLRHYFESVAESIHNNHSGHTLVHCSAGRSRSPALIMAYLMKHKGVSLRQAHEWVLENRPHIRPNAGFWRQLMEYERDLHGKNTVRMVATPCGVFPEALDNEENSAYCMNV